MIIELIKEQPYTVINITRKLLVKKEIPFKNNK